MGTQAGAGAFALSFCPARRRRAAAAALGHAALFSMCVPLPHPRYSKRQRII